MNAVHRSIQPDAIGGILAVIGSAFIGVGAVQTAGSHQDVWSNPWFDGGWVVLATGFLIAISVIVSWWRSRRRRRPSTVSPLLLILGSEKSRIFDNAIWAVGLALHIINQTGDPITIAQGKVLNGSHVTQHPLLTEECQRDLSSWIAALSSDHESELFAGETTVPPHGSVTRWFINSAYASPQNGGRPRLIVQIKDTLNNTYELNVPARRAIIYPPSEA
jgi:hypothetical protein